MIRKILLIIILLLLISIIPILTSIDENEAQANYYVALQYTLLMETGEIERNKQNIKKILDYLNKVIKTKPNHPQTHYLHAYILAEYQKKPKKALYHIKKALISFPKSPHVNIKASLIYLNLSYLFKKYPVKKHENLNNALIHTNIAIKHSNNKKETIEYKNQLAQIHIELTNYKEALNIFKEAIEEDPNNPKLHNNLAYFLIKDTKNKDPQKALIHAKKAVELSKTTEPYILDTLANVYFNLGEYKKAIEIEKEAYRIEKSKRNKKIFENRIKQFEEKLKKAK